MSKLQGGPHISILVTSGRTFIIMDAPTDQNLGAYISDLKTHKVGAVVRACEPSYSIEPLTKAGIDVKDLAYDDGAPPPQTIVGKWLEVVLEQTSKSNSIAVHCVAGLGRAPVLVAIALIESGMEAMDAVEFIRKRRRGAINQRQLKFLMSYTPRSGGGSCSSCVLL